MKNILTFLFLLFSVAVFAQPVRTTITDDGVNVTIATPVNTRVVPICDFHWTFVDGQLQMWIEGRNELIPGGRLGNFTINGATTQGTKLAALGAISDQCAGGGGLDSLYLADGTLLASGDTIPDVTVSDSTSVLRSDINNIQTLTGRPDGSTHLGTMGQGTQYPDNLTIKTFADSTDAKLGRVQSSIATLPAGYAITSAEKIASQDSTYTFQKQVNQIRDSTLIGVETVEAIMNLPSTTPEFSRILVRNTGAMYIVRDSSDFKVSDTANDFSGSTTSLAGTLTFKSDTLSIVKLKNAVTPRYAFYEPQEGAIQVSKFSKSGISDRNKLQRAIDYSFWTRNMYRGSSAKVNSDSVDFAIASKVIIDNDLYLTDSVIIRHNTYIEGINGSPWERAFSPRITVDLNSATRSAFVTDRTAGSQALGGGIKNLTIVAASPALCALNLYKAHNIVVDNITIDKDVAASGRNFENGIITEYAVNQQIENIELSNINVRPIWVKVPTGGSTSTTLTLRSIYATYSGYGIVIDSGAVFDVHIHDPILEWIDSAIITIGKGTNAFIDGIYTESCTSTNYIEIGVSNYSGGGSTSVQITNSILRTNTTPTAGSAINCNYAESVILDNVEISDKLRAITTTANTSLLSLNDVKADDITTDNTLHRGLLTFVNAATKVSMSNVNISSLGYSAGSANGVNKLPFYVADDSGDALSGIYDARYNASAGNTPVFTFRRGGGTLIAPLAAPTSAIVGLTDYQAYVGTTNGNVIAGRTRVVGNGTAVTDAAFGFPADYVIGLMSTTANAASNEVARFTSTKRLGVGTASPAAAGDFETGDAVTNTVTRGFRISHFTSGTPSSGFGVSNDYMLENASNGSKIAAINEVIWTDATASSEDAHSMLQLIKAGTLDTAIIVKSNGQIQEMEYGGHTFTGTPTNFAAWDVNGNVVERTAAELASDINAWKLGGQNTTTNANIGTNDAFRFGIGTNGTARLYFSSDGRMYNNTLTDIYLAATDSARLEGAGSKFDLTSGFSRLYIGSNVGFQFNNSTQAAAFNVGDNQASALTVNIQGGATMLQLASTDGAEAATIGSTTAGSRATLQGDTTATIKSDRVLILGNTGAAEPTLEIGEDADNGSNYVALKSPASLSANYTQTLTAATGEIPVVLKASASLNFPSTNSSECSDLTITVTGATEGDPAIVGYPSTVFLTGAVYTAQTTATDTVTVRYCNTSLLGAGNPDSAVFEVKVFK